MLWFRLVCFTLLSISLEQVSGSPSTTLCRPEDGYFRCPRTRRCIARYIVHDFSLDCGRRDNADEFGGFLDCTDDEFLCRFTRKCIPRYLINTKFSCKLNDSTLLPCRKDIEFTCKHSRICLPRHMVLNGKRECDSLVVKDGSDEEAGFSSCLSSEFPCLENVTIGQQCIPREWVGDGVDDCTNGRDEVADFTQCHNDTEFECVADGRCLPRYRVMDGYNDCSDAADERQALICNSSTEFRCQDNGRCIPRSWRGNKLVNCQDGSDETSQQVGNNGTCLVGEFRCHNGRRCIPNYLLCDGMDHCGDCSDEVDSCVEPRMLRCPNAPQTCVQRTYSCDEYADCPENAEDVRFITGFKCNKLIAGLDNRVEYCTLPQWSLKDDYPNCDDSSDLCFVNGTLTCHRCLSSNVIISPKQLCDGIFDCPDLSDECLCANQVPGAAPSRLLCDRVCYGVPNSPGCAACGLNMVSCGSNDVCIEKSQVCDGKVDCPVTELDEMHCGRMTNGNGSNAALDFSCDVIPPVIRNAALNYLNRDLASTLLPENATKCDGVPECYKFEDECSERANCSVKPAVCDQIPLQNIPVPGSLIGTDQVVNILFRKCNKLLDLVLGRSVCNGIDECEEGYDESNCPDQFSCSAGQVNTVIQGIRNRVSIPYAKTCNLVSDCVNSTDELNCSESTHFYCLKGNPLYVARTKVLDGVPDCLDNSDECPPNYLQNDALASNEQMIKIQALEILVWFMAVLALLGNLMVMVQTAIYFKRLSSEQMRHRLGLINRAMIFNLAVADFVMGVVLLVVAVKAVQFSGSYCLYDKSWRSSELCDVIGVTTVLSSETSVLTLVCITSYRLYSVFWPFQSRSVRARVAAMWVLLIWSLSLLIALLPFARGLSAYMITSAQITPSPYFHTDQVPLADMRRFALRIAATSNQSKPEVTSYDWTDVDNYLSTQHPSAAPSTVAYFGYYSSSSVCIPRFYRVTESESNVNAMSSVVITFNFVALLYIGAAYVAIYTKSRVGNSLASSSSNKAAKNKQNTSVQRKITVLIATDMCCWLPICIMTFLSMGGVVMPPTSYAVSAIVLLPINSSLNPIIYTNLPQTIYSGARRIVDRCRRGVTSTPKRTVLQNSTSDQHHGTKNTKSTSV